MSSRIVKTSLLWVFCSASFVAQASEEAGHHEAASLFSWDMAFKVANFIALVALLHFFAKKPLTRMMGDAALVQRETFEEQAQAVAAAEKKLVEFQEKMKAQEAELALHRQHALAGIEAERKRILAEAEDTARNIEQATQMRIDQSLVRAKADLKAFLAAEATKLAQESIRAEMGPAKQESLMENYAKVVGRLG